MITIRNLQLRYGREKVLDGLNLDLHPGSIYGLLGANGSGKSTLLRVLTGALRPHAGDISGQGVTGYVAQKFSLYEDLSVQANIEFRGRCYGIPSSELHLRLESVLDQTGLSSFRRSRTSHLSYGWKQRVALAAALCHRPSLLLLDETTAGIDPGGREVLWSILSDCCRQGATILLTTHQG